MCLGAQLTPSTLLWVRLLEILRAGEESEDLPLGIILNDPYDPEKEIQFRKTGRGCSVTFVLL